MISGEHFEFLKLKILILKKMVSANMEMQRLVFSLKKKKNYILSHQAHMHAF